MDRSKQFLVSGGGLSHFLNVGSRLINTISLAEEDLEKVKSIEIFLWLFCSRFRCQYFIYFSLASPQTVRPLRSGLSDQHGFMMNQGVKIMAKRDFCGMDNDCSLLFKCGYFNWRSRLLSNKGWCIKGCAVRVVGKFDFWGMVGGVGSTISSISQNAT